jgi:hypothetical protein
MSNGINEYGLYDNHGLNAYDLDFNEKALLNLARFLYYNANDGAFDDMSEAVAEVYNIIRGEFYIEVGE